MKLTKGYLYSCFGIRHTEVEMDDGTLAALCGSTANFAPIRDGENRHYKHCERCVARLRKELRARS